ncbi:MAG: hypothetical protein HRF46_08490 [Acidobacteriota bacterium]|jgi:hypothetical protein
MRRAAALFTLLLGGCAAAAASPPPTPAVPWGALHFEARKLLLAATSVVRADLLPAEQLVPLLRQPPGDAALAPPTWVVRLTVETDLPMGRDETVTTWLHPTTFAALQTHKRTYGKRQYEKVFRYVTNGYYEWRRAPASEREAGLPPEAWSDRREGWNRLATAPPVAAVLVDPYALLFLASAAQLHLPGRRLTIRTLSRDQLVELAMTDGGLTRRPVDYLESCSSGERRHRGDQLVRLVHVAAATGITPARAQVDLGFLGMQGELSVFLDAASGVPVELVGRTRSLGQLVVRLTRVELASAPTP